MSNDWQVSAAAWELAALSFRYPGAELADAVSSGEWADAAREIAAALGLALPEGFGAHASADGLRPEATRLFVGAPEPAVSPYEGVWRAADDGVQALLFVNPHSMAVERFMRECGLGRPEGANEPLDHAATECELLERLALRAAAPADADDALPGGSPEAAYDLFLAEHVRAWMPRFAERTAEESRHPFYRDAAAFLAALVG
ncbi:TorD/DmsD family molecular chaperone [Arabiibacter massiliensis]|uniref:TorD/DmsD family molecular chaperone n=1 Tax=Arabiibacter massiliensis TaxID=1870985 RepID=UPI0009BA0C22|nr:molecular chaperone TorD family protein [Arabiibacter massiliensis]